MRGPTRRIRNEPPPCHETSEVIPPPSLPATTASRRDAKDNIFERDFAKAEATLGELQRSLSAASVVMVSDASVTAFRGHLAYAAGLVSGLEKQAA